MKTIIIDGIEYNLTPKVVFHKGDWITNGKLLVGQVTSFDGEYYHYVCDGLEQPLHASNAHKWHLWTIKDAKDGDVLAMPAGAFIYNGNNGGGSCPGCYCGINTLGKFQTGVEHHWTGKPVFPATKEQSDTLMKAMADAGYTFDFKKKKLKKIEQKPTDEEMKEALRTEYEKGRADTIAEMQNPAWSEEDEGHIDSLLKRLEGICKSGSTFISTRFAISEDEDWLKSLRPQNRWKPSDEQIVALENTLKYFRMLNAFGETIDGLKELEEQLKKLREE